MKRAILFLLIVLFSVQSFSQLLSTNPNFLLETTDPLTITMDATKGNQGLLNYTPTSDVYVHIGVITNLSTSSSDWKYVKFTWGTVNPLAQANYVGSNVWSYTINGGLRSYFGIVNPAETIQKIAILFRNGSGINKQTNTNGSDMYIPVYTPGLATKFIVPFIQPTYVPQPENISKNIGDNIAMTGVSSVPATLKLYLNGTMIQTATAATTISASPTIIAGGTQTLVAEANDGSTIKTDTVKFFVAGTINIAPLPAGARDGINYNGGTSATMVLYAPSKGRVSVIGEFAGSNWTEQSQYQMNKTPDGNYWWITLNGLTPGAEYAYQYLVDGATKIADPYTEKVLDPNNDNFISATTYPGLKAYPAGASGIVSVLQTSAPAYTWAVNSFSRPDKRNLMIYELLVRDHVAAHDWKTLRDTLNYLKNLGINTIEIMPFNEFEGNLSWGYNPDFYFAPDKYYGPANTLKEFVDSCHKKGIAVVMDIVLNHSLGSSPMVQLYYDAITNRPAANNPWFNPTAKHPYNVGYDMNHESLATRYFVSRVVEHWLTNYKVDGFRFDLSKGFTQTNSCTTLNCDTDPEINAWSAYDASRIAIWKRYYDTIQLKSPNAYTILEHFADNSEEVELSNYGMMLWGNLNYNYTQASMGYTTDGDFSWGIYTQRGWTNPNLVTYMESHDEERLMYKNLQSGNSSGSYNIKNLNTALKRIEMAAAFFFTIPGPKMVWQFGELGYDYSINYCQNGTINGGCRTDPKPIRWDYLQIAERKHVHDIFSALMKLRYNPLFADAFVSGQIDKDLSNNFKWLKVTGTTGKIVVMGNFGVNPTAGSLTFPTPGTWYDYPGGTTITATGVLQGFFLLPGEYHVYLNMDATLPVTLTNFSGKNNNNVNVLSWAVVNEINLKSYELQRSTDGQNFSAVTSITTLGKTTYNYADDITGIGSPVYYYRLKSINTGGSFSYSAVVKIRVISKGWYAEVTPNPFVQNLKINIESNIQGIATIILRDVSGKNLVKQNVPVSPGNNAFELSQASKFAKGTYVLTIITPQQTENFKVVKTN